VVYVFTLFPYKSKRNLYLRGMIFFESHCVFGFVLQRVHFVREGYNPFHATFQRVLGYWCKANIVELYWTTLYLCIRLLVRFIRLCIRCQARSRLSSTLHACWFAFVWWGYDFLGPSVFCECLQGVHFFQAVFIKGGVHLLGKETA